MIDEYQAWYPGLFMDVTSAKIFKSVKSNENVTRNYQIPSR